MSMSTLEVGQKLVALVRGGKAVEAMQTLYHPEIVSVEAAGPPGERQTTGVAACLEKGKQWREANEIHGVQADGPFPHGDRFAVYLRYEITPKATGKRTSMAEVAVYTVRDGKVVHEEFFYAM